jgi:nicotinamidase-related amidase
MAAAQEPDQQRRERPMATDQPASRTGLVLVDPYNDMLSEEGKVWPAVKDVARSVGLHQHLRDLLEGVRAADVPVFIAPHRRWRPGDADNWQTLAPPFRKLAEAQLFALDGWGGQWHPEFGPRPGDVIAYEHWGMNGFANTNLDQQLRQHGVCHIILAGMTAIGCVEGTGRHAVELGYSVTLVKDATATWNDEAMRAAHEINGPLYASSVLTTDQVLDSLR